MTPSYSALKSELTADPLGRGYTSMTDAQCATSLNTANIAVQVDVPSAEVVGTLYETGAWQNIELLALDGKTGVETHDAALGSAKALLQFCAPPGGTFACSVPAVYARVQSDLTNLVAESTIASTDKSNVLGLASVTVSRASQIGWSQGVSAADVSVARGS